MDLSWMSWTPVTAAFFIFIGLLLVGMSAWELASPTRERRGFLPIITTRGDRLFIALLSSAFFHLAWLALIDQPLYWMTMISLVWLVVLLRWG